MVIDRTHKIVVWTIWALVFPLGFWISFSLAPPFVDFLSIDFAIFVILMIAAASIPIVVNNTPMTVSQWISLVVFLKFGLVAELALGQIVVLVVMLRLKLTKEQVYRYALNSSMFTIISVVSAFIFYSLGGTHDTFTINNVSFITLAAVYLISTFVINQLLLVQIQRILFKNNRPYYSQDLLWEGLSILVVFPLGLILYFLYNSIGIISAILIGIPVISMLLILNIYNTSNQKNIYLQRAMEFGHRLTERLQADEVLEVFIDNLLKMFPSDYLYVLDNIDGEHLEVIRSYENGKMVQLDIEPLKRSEGIAGMAWGSEKGLVFQERKNYQHILSGYLPDDAESVLVVPMIKNNDVTGVIFLATAQKRAYNKYHLMIVDILCSYLAIALENARHYEKTKYQSERDGLTKLYNARVFTEKLEELAMKFDTKEIDHISVLLIDIDHFKSVNDTYGHQSGNKILSEMAEILKALVGTKGVLCRYGGEEFAILLPGITKEEASFFGEHIRETIQNRAFVMYDDLAEVRRKLTARLTVSIGISSLPDDTDDHSALLRYADRALYTGAKRVGRNKVAEYVS